MAVKSLVLLDKDLLGKSLVGTEREIRYERAGNGVYHIPANEIKDAGYETVPETIELRIKVVKNPEYEATHRDRALEC